MHWIHNTFPHFRLFVQFIDIFLIVVGCLLRFHVDVVCFMLLWFVFNRVTHFFSCSLITNEHSQKAKHEKCSIYSNAKFVFLFSFLCLYAALICFIQPVLDDLLATGGFITPLIIMFNFFNELTHSLSSQKNWLIFI